MLDPITSLLAACVNCHPPDANAVEPDVAICTNNPRSSQNVAQQHAIQQNSLSGCISPPDSTSASSQLSFTTASVINASQRQAQNQTDVPPRPIAPETVVAVSWSNPATNRVAMGKTEVRTATNPVLQFGSRGQDVTRLQTQLKQLKLYTGAIDSIFGQQTKAAVVQFQRSEGLQADGVVGARTWTALQSVARQPQSASSAQAPTQASPQNRTQNPNNPQSKAQGDTQVNTQGDRPATPPPSSAAVAPSAAPTTEAQKAQSSSPQSTESKTQSDQESDSSSQFPFNFFWIFGWGIIYGSGWIFILKDTVKEIKGFHFITTARKKTSKRTTRTVVTHVQSGKRKTVPQVVIPNRQTPNVPVEPAPVSHPDSVLVAPQATQPQPVQTQSVAPQATQPVNSDASDRPKVAVGVGVSDRDNQRLDEAVNVNEPVNQPASLSQSQVQTHDQTDGQSDSVMVTQFVFDQVALSDPWQDEADPAALQVLEVALADGGQILPLQNVFIAPPRSRFSRSRKRPKKPALIANYSYYSYPKPVLPNKPEVVSGHDARDRHQQAKAG